MASIKKSPRNILMPLYYNVIALHGIVVISSIVHIKKIIGSAKMKCSCRTMDYVGSNLLIPTLKGRFTLNVLRSTVSTRLVQFQNGIT